PNVVRGDVGRLPFADAAFDAVLSLDVLYHIAAPGDLAALREIARVLKPGGHAVLNLPAYEFLRGRHDLAIHTRQRYTRRGPRPPRGGRAAGRAAVVPQPAPLPRRGGGPPLPEARAPGPGGGGAVGPALAAGPAESLVDVAAAAGEPAAPAGRAAAVRPVGL